MCGIAGYIGTGSDKLLRQMCSVLAHRGPDASGVWHDEYAALAHTRLSILDLSETGAQPMHADGISISYNGEVYNCWELRRELEGQGVIFKGHSDTEVVLHGYRVWGDVVLEKLEGMFALAIWDGVKKRLLLARDRVGIKPLFFAPHAMGGLAFASEIKAILEHPGVSKQTNRAAVDTYLALGYVPSPETIYVGIQSLRPGEKLVWKDDQLKCSIYADVARVASTETIEDEGQLIDELDRHLNRAVQAHLLADVEVGAFLSGGVDSSLVAAIASRYTDSPIKTFTIGFGGSGDERHFARMVAEHIGSEHHEALAEIDLAGHLPQLMKNLEQPLFDNSVLPTWLVSGEARSQVKVVLSGDGGDEAFFGYDWTRWALSLPDLLPSVGMSGWKWAYQRGAIGKAKRLIYDLSHQAEGRYLRRISTDRDFRHWLYTAEYLEEVVGAAPLSGIQQSLASRVGADRFAIADLKHYLPEDVLFKVDRMSMAHSLEVRVPLLDLKLLSWTMGLPVEARFRHGHGKYLLRKVASRYLPEEILKPRKQGFTIPIGHWLNEGLGEQVREMFSSARFADRGFIRPDRALRLLEMHRSGRFELGHRIWSLVVLEMWFRICFDGDEATWHV